MRRLYLIFLLIIFTAVLIGCSQPELVEPGEPSLLIPSPQEGLGVVHGVLLNTADNKPVVGIPYLSKNLSSEDPEMPATISFSLQYDPRGVIDLQTGEFYFKDLEPADNYVLVLHYGPGNLLIVREDASDYPLMIAVEPGKTIDIGTVKVQEP